MQLSFVSLMLVCIHAGRVASFPMGGPDALGAPGLPAIATSTDSLVPIHTLTAATPAPLSSDISVTIPTIPDVAPGHQTQAVHPRSVPFPLLGFERSTVTYILITALTLTGIALVGLLLVCAVEACIASPPCDEEVVLFEANNDSDSETDSETEKNDENVARREL